jgi:hypothetical protein
MATIVTIHGTFAQATASDASGGPASDPQWWETASTFERDLGELLHAETGQLNVKAFPWSGNNSEIERREAGERLANELRDLEAQGEPYCIVAHSHGGSIAASALLKCAARKQPLQNLKRWITVGTPFVNFRKELWLLTRLSLMKKVIFVASMMLLMMFLVYLAATSFSGERMLFGGTFPRILLVTAVMTSLPAIFFYLVFRYFDNRSLLLYHRRITRRAKDKFGPRWLSLAHPDDEAIQGLAYLPQAKLSFFDKSFAVSAITLVSVVMLPLLYFMVLLSPATMVGLANWLKTEIYDARSSPEAEAALKALRQELMTARQDESTTESDDWRSRRQVWREYRAKRSALEEQYPDLDTIERGLRFKARFFERDGQPCEGGTLCGGGHDLSVNSGLLLHVVTDELSWALGVGDLERRSQRWFRSLIVPGVLVPAIFGLLALALMVLIQAVATLISRLSSGFLNKITNAEVKRSAFGNDTEGEVAIGATDRPSWLDVSPARLPSAIADLVTDYSNIAASRSIARFRHAIGQIAFADPKHSAETAISTYFTWKELVHSSYFDVPEFRKLVAQVISRAEGFAPSEKFKTDPDFQHTAQWLAEIEGAPGKPMSSDLGDADEKDVKAVSAVVASTVKAEP